MKIIPGNLFKNLEISWNFVTVEKIGTLILVGSVSDLCIKDLAII